ncbi:SDR family NAD(P)-dependent oxidoreductase [Streptomyces sp. NPDC052016]|uniref:SDR family NAD(P)-dependent oxidoreductase n=1 Tax=Streptomyces sp. NPDC052016 TaxID=3365680 RepID=UPI0037D71A5D
MNDVDGLSALVTGGAPGVGRATAGLPAGRGARGAVLDLDPSGAGEPLLGYRADVTDDPSGRAALAAAAADLGGLDVLVHDAGIGAQGSVEDAEDYDDAEWHRVLDVGVCGLVRVARAAHLRRSARAAIVDTCSTAATAGLPRRALRGAAKGAVHSLALAAPADHVREGIRVDRLAPGTADTPWIGRLLDPAPDPAVERAALEARRPTGRMVDAAEVDAAGVVGAVAHLAGPLSGATTGTSLAVDGGMQGLRPRPAAAR